MLRSTACFALACLATSCLAQQPTPAPGRWIASWATAQQGPEIGQPPVDDARLNDATVRQVVHLSAGGPSLRVHLSNAFGTQPLTIDASAIALPTPNPGSIVPGSSHPLTFGGRPGVTIPIGAEMISDPVAWNVAPLTSLAITFHLPTAPSVQTAHPGSRATSFVLAGNHVADNDLPNSEKTVRWMQIAEVDVTAPKASTVIAFGDSITDGHASTTDANERWPDVLAARLQSARGKSAVVNEGIGGNHLLTNGLGQSALERLDRDAIAIPGARWILLLEGINDLGGLGRNPRATPADHTELVFRLEQAFTQIIDRAHAHGLKVYGATITPDRGSDYYHPNQTDEDARQALNAWIRQPGHFDAVVDFDQAIRDPAHPDQLLPAFDSGDHLHPGPAGYKAMGDAVPVNLFR